MTQNIRDFFAAKRAAGPSGRRRENPETSITRQIREVLKIMRVPTWKHWAGTFSQKGIPDLVGTIPGGRAFYCEVKAPGGTARAEQVSFLADHEAAGAVCLIAYGPRDVVLALAKAGYKPAVELARNLYPLSTREK